ncbi:hypothetical protein DPMN_141502 [Dreissena polymorpha]|uniref:Uncharacterized protein n=1 Tax=Dreissena polymorpha TaxID=45954 RepID=A0A9D4G9U0_DREPO|nr:hypothetical protein DPMN_141502 [Dreissena polymorpha]
MADKELSDSRNDPSKLIQYAEKNSSFKLSCTNTRENYLVGWETLEVFLKFPTRVLPLDHRTTLCFISYRYTDNDDDDDDDEFEEAGFEPSSSKNAEKDSSTGTSCFKNRLESANNDDDDDDEEAGFEPSSSDGAEMDLATGTSCFKNRQERASLKDDDGSVSRNEPSSCTENNSSSSSPGSKMSTNSQSTELKISVNTSIHNDDDDEEAGIEPSSSNCRNGLSYKHILFQKQTRKGKLKDKAEANNWLNTLRKVQTHSISLLLSKCSSKM